MYSKQRSQPTSYKDQWYHQKMMADPAIPVGEPIEDPQDGRTYYKNAYSGTLPIGSHRLQKREKRKRRLKYVTRFLFLGGAIGLVVISALRFTAVTQQSIHEAIMNFYYLFFGVIVALSQFNMHKVVDQFRFLNYYWGKGIFCLFLASLSLSNTSDVLVEWVMTIYFVVTAVLMFILAIFDRAQDKEQAKKDERIIQQTYNDGDCEGGVDFETLPFANYFKQKLYGGQDSANPQYGAMNIEDFEKRAFIQAVNQKHGHDVSRYEEKIKNALDSSF